MKRIFFITSNVGKFKEVVDIFKKNLPDVMLEMYPAEKVEIQSSELEKIALFSARYIREKEKIDNFFVEDAGLFINALKGFPGPYSSYVYKTIGVNGILKLMKNVKDRRAFFKAVIAFCWKGDIYLFTGVVHGKIAEEARGTQGFGFDPIFIPNGDNRTFAEMTIEEKNKLSHRGKAIRKLINFLKLIWA